MADSNVGIFADDLTGALDACARFPSRGMATFVSISTTIPIGAKGMYQVVALNMDSRRQGERKAREAAIRASSSLKAAGFEPLFNKVDSTLRGHPGLEADAVLGAINAELILVAPAFPAQGRTVVDGHLLVRGVPVDQTEVGRDPLSPVPGSSIVDLMRTNTGLEVASIRLDDVRHGPERLAELFERLAAGGAVAAVIDSESDDDLWHVIVAASRCDRRVLFAGSGGLAGSLANAYGTEQAKSPQGDRLARQPYLVVAGSQREIVRDQLETLRRQAKARIVEIDSDRLLDAIEGAAERERAIGEATRSIKQERSTALLLTSQNVGPGAGRAALLSVARDRLVAELGAITRAVISAGVNALVLLGGDTALGTLKAIDATGIVLQDEPLPGIPAGIIHGGAMDGAPVVTKAGAFGDEETLLHIFDYLSSGRRRR